MKNFALEKILTNPKKPKFEKKKKKKFKIVEPSSSDESDSD